MRLSREELSICIIVRRVSTGAKPFVWQVQRTDTDSVIHTSADRFRSMEAAYRAGQAKLADFIPRRYQPPGVTDFREWQASQAGATAEYRQLMHG